MHRSSHIAFCTGVCIFMPPLSFAQTNTQYDLTWYSLNGGGLTQSSSGVYETGVTIGQVGAEIVRNDQYELQGGFWAGACDPPTIIQPPDEVTVCVFSPVVLSARAVGSNPLLYQWRFNGADLPGATNDTFELAFGEVADSGDYTLVVTNECGTAASAAVRVNVYDAPNITQDPVDATACLGGQMSFHVSADSPIPMSYQWRYKGINLSNGTTETFVINPVGWESVGYYDVAVFNDCGLALSNLAVLQVVEGAAGDVSGDGFLDGWDIAAFVDVMLTTPTGPIDAAFCSADMNGDGRIDQTDVAQFLALLLSAQ